MINQKKTFIPEQCDFKTNKETYNYLSKTHFEIMKSYMLYIYIIVDF